MHMALPMLAGTVAINSYNFVDTYFVSQLGTIPLAAMEVTLPVVTFVTFISSGIGTGITTLASHSLGKKEHIKASIIITNGLLLMILFSLIIAVIGTIVMEPLFRILGADDIVFPLIKRYIFVWYFGIPFIAIPMMGNGILLALGNSKIASLFMTFGAVLNCILDPIFIFGIGFMPALGIMGAALATVISQISSAILLLYLLIKKHKMFVSKHITIKIFFKSCVAIMKFAIPSSISMTLTPISAGIITAIVSKYGNEAVAATSAASRVEMLAFLVPMSLGISLTPFISQNFGARRFDRIEEAKRFSSRFAILYGLFIAICFFILAPFFAQLFTKDSLVASIFILYLRIIPFGYGCMEVHRYCGFFFTGLHKPALNTLNNFIRTILVLIPLSLLGSYIAGIIGIFFARLIIDITAGVITLNWVERVLKKIKNAT